MAFSSNFFLFAFLPVFLVIYILSPRSWRNGILLAGNFSFYFFDAGYLAWILLASIVFNQVIALRLEKPTGSRRCAIFIIGVVGNLVVLFYYKYTRFLWGAADPLLQFASIDIGPPPLIDLPIGISFFTFQALSYIADVFRDVTRPRPHSGRFRGLSLAVSATHRRPHRPVRRSRKRSLPTPPVARRICRRTVSPLPRSGQETDSCRSNGGTNRFGFWPSWQRAYRGRRLGWSDGVYPADLL